MVVGLKPIETAYKGYRFRSRLEARWAVFFDTLGVRWEYEPQGYDLGDAGWYLPDFWLETVSMWAEVKAGEFSAEELAKARALANQSGRPVLKLIGTPRYTRYWMVMPGSHAYEHDVRDDEACDGCDVDVLLDDQYVHDEHRWFVCPGYDPVADGEEWIRGSERTRDAYAAARGARFEHGESPDEPRAFHPRTVPT